MKKYVEILDYINKVKNSCNDETSEMYLLGLCHSAQTIIINDDELPYDTKREYYDQIQQVINTLLNL